MPEQPPPLPSFLAGALPFGRAALRLPAGAVAGRRVHALDHGPRTAPVALLQHGNPTWCFLWRKVLPGLVGMRVVAPDLLGLGLSETLTLREHTLDTHVDALAQLLDALAIDQPIILVGQDWGGPLVAALGARFGERVAGLVLANTSVLVPEHPRGTTFHRLARLPVVSDLLFRLLGFPQAVLHRVQADPASIRGEVARAYRWPLRGWRRRAAPLALARMVPDGPDHPSLPALRGGEAWVRSFAGPIELVWGTRDPILGRALPRHERALPGARVTRTDRAGHFLQEEVPELLVAAVRRVAGLDSSGPG